MSFSTSPSTPCRQTMVRSITGENPALSFTYQSSTNKPQTKIVTIATKLPQTKVSHIVRKKNFAFVSIKMQSKDKSGALPKLTHRKTSAEIVSEARKSLLQGGPSGNVRLVSTKRPNTPNVNKRQLYGDTLHPPGRPPSAFNLKYLQYETRPLPCLEPISDEKEAHKRIERSGSLDTIQEASARTKLPALREPPRVFTAGSLESCKSNIHSVKHAIIKSFTFKF